MTLFTALYAVIPENVAEETQLFPCVVLLLYVNTVINPILLILSSAKVGLPNRQIGQSSDYNISNGRSNTV